MRSAFDTSIPARKPRTQIGRVLTEMTTTQPEESEAQAAALESVYNGKEERWPIASDELAPESVAPAARADVQAVASVSSEWDRLAALRKRLDLAAEPPSAVSQPQDTAAAVRKHIEDLRARADAASKERAELTATLGETRSMLARVEAELEQERTIRRHVEAQAAEREQVALQAVSEAEALASERDLVLGELAERQRLQSEERVLLTDAETALNRHRAANEAAARDLAEARHLLDLRITEISELESRIQIEAAERAKAEARCRELEADLARTAATAQALAAIKEMVLPR